MITLLTRFYTLDRGGQTAILFRWSTGLLPSRLVKIVDQCQRTTEIELLLLCCSEFWPILKKISNRRNYQIMGFILILILILRDGELQHAVDYSENSGSRIAE
jgi:hypothetical protein